MEDTDLHCFFPQVCIHIYMLYDPPVRLYPTCSHPTVISKQHQLHDLSSKRSDVVHTDNCRQPLLGLLVQIPLASLKCLSQSSSTDHYWFSIIFDTVKHQQIESVFFPYRKKKVMTDLVFTLMWKDDQLHSFILLSQKKMICFHLDQALDTAGHIW